MSTAGTPVIAAPVVPAPAPPRPSPAAPAVAAAPAKPAPAAAAKPAPAAAAPPPPPPAEDALPPPPLPAAAAPAPAPATFVPPPLSDAAPPPPVLGAPLQAITGQGVPPLGHCSWDDLLAGALPAWATVTVISTAAFLVGCLLTGLLARWRHNAAFYGDAAAARAADAEALPSPAAEYVGRRRPDEWKTPGTVAKEAAVRASGVTGPLGVGAVVSSLDGGRGSGSGRPSSGDAPPPPRRSSAAGSNLAPAITAGSTPAVRAAYEVEDLDDEWRALVAEVDARLAAKRAKPCDARERALVVRALLASGPAEPADAALDRAALAVRDGRGGRGGV